MEVICSDSRGERVQYERERGDSKYIIGRKLLAVSIVMSVLDTAGLSLESAAQQDVVEVELRVAGGESGSSSPALDISEHHGDNINVSSNSERGYL